MGTLALLITLWSLNYLVVMYIPVTFFSYTFNMTKIHFKLKRKTRIVINDGIYMSYIISAYYY